MRKYLLIGLIGFSLCFLSFPSTGLAAIVDRIVAVVNGEIITLHDVNTRLEIMLKSKPVTDQDEINNMRREVLDDLIDRKIIAQEMQALKLRVEEREVDDAIERIKKRNNITQEQFETQLNRMGLEIDTFRKDIRDQIGRMKVANAVLRPGIIIPDDRIEAYYEKHKDEFQILGQVFLRNIQLPLLEGASEEEVKTQMTAAEAIIKEIRGGLSFVEAARKYSKGSNAKSGGDMGLVSVGEMNQTIRSAIKDLKESEISKPIRLLDTLQILQVVEVYDTEAKIKRRAKQQIQDILAAEELEKKYSEWLAEKRAKANIKVSF